MINGHGNHLTGLQDKIVADFSTNVFANPLTEEILEHIRKNVDSIRNYPDCNCTLLREKIAGHFQLKSRNILITNGSTEAFYLLAHAFEGMDSIIPIPSFSEYQDACRLYKHQVEFISTITPLQRQSLDQKLIWLGNPNNPDGRYLSHESLRSLMDNHPKSYFVIDEAYIDLCKNGQSFATAVNEYPNLIVIKSFTKRFAIPGIRLGYVLANKDIINQLLQYHMPWAVNSLALKTGEFIVDNYAHLQPNTVDLLKESAFFQEEISQISDFEIIPSTCNYFLVRLKNGIASELKQYLIDNYGFLIRDAANFRGLNHSWFRIAAQDRERNTELIKALKQWASQKTVKEH